MSINIDPKKTALQIECVQNDFFKKEDGVQPMGSQIAARNLEAIGGLAKIRKLVAEARRVGVPVILVGRVKRLDGGDILPSKRLAQHHVGFLMEGTPGADFLDELKPGPGDHVVIKRRPSSFFNTDLDLRLKCLEVSTLIIAGLQTNTSVASTVADAYNRDYDIIVVGDCLGARTPEDNEYFVTRFFPGMAKVATSQEILSSLAELPSK